MSVRLAQKKQVLRYLQNHKRGITTYDAFAKLGCTRLAARISELRDEGNIIIDWWEEDEEGTRYKRYLLQKGV